MAEKIVNGKKVDVPIEYQKTAPINAFASQLPESKVPIPAEEDALRAKNWVDKNRK